MRIEETFIFRHKNDFDPELYEAAMELGICEADDDPHMVVEGIRDKIMDYAKQYSGNEEPTGFIMQDPQDPDHYVALMSGGGTNYRIDMLKGKVADEEMMKSFQEILGERKNLQQQGYKPVDTRTWLQRNKSAVAQWVIGGAVAVAALPLVAALIVSIGPAIVGAATVAGFGWLGWKTMQLFKGEDERRG